MRIINITRLHGFLLLGIFLIVSFFIFLYTSHTLWAQETADSDADGLSDIQEKEIYATDLRNADTDGDGFSDGEEITKRYSPRHADKQRLIDVDSDNDYLNDDWELRLGTSITNPDSDGDLYLDGTEVAASFDPLRKGEYKLQKRIEVNISKQELSYFMGDIEMGRFLISSGVPGWSTLAGDFTILSKVPVKVYTGPGYSFPNTKWNLEFTKKNGWRYWIHGAYWHNKFGTRQSHGCVNVSYADMEKLYWWAEYGTKVKIY